MHPRERDKKKTDVYSNARIGKRSRANQNSCPNYWTERSFEEVLADLAHLSVDDFEKLVLNSLASGHETGMYTVLSAKHKKSSNIYMAGDPEEDTRFKDTNGTLWYLEEKLGSGNSGDVYRAFSKERERAIKLVRFTENLTATRRMISRLLREVVIHRHLMKSDPTMCQSALLFESIVIPENPIYPYLGALMPLGGISLESVLGIRRGLGLSIRSIWIITNGILEAIAHIHANGIAHGDLKPGNILLSCVPKKKYSNTTNEIKIQECKDDRHWIFNEGPHLRHQRKWKHKLPYFKFITESGQNLLDIGGKDSDFDIKIIDFGASVSISKFKEEQRICGSYYLKPPEDVLLTAVPSEVYKRDIWALGLFTLNLWTGHPYIPYKSKVNLIPLMAKLTSTESIMREQAKLIVKTDISDAKKRQDLIDYVEGRVDYLVDESVLSLSQCFNGGRSLCTGVFLLYDFIKTCLNTSQKHRLNAIELLNHRFITDMPSDIKKYHYNLGGDNSKEFPTKHRRRSSKRRTTSKTRL